MRKLTAHAMIVRALAGLGATLLVGAVLTGCTPEVQQSPSPVPSSAATPMFASDEEALAAAEKAYAEYLKVSDEIAQAGGANPERIDAVVVDSWAAKEKGGFAQLQEKGYKQVGSTKYDHFKLQGVSDVEISAYVCSDLSGTSVVDAMGNAVTPPDRPTRISVLATFAHVRDTKSLALESYEPWSVDFCN